MAFSWVQKLKQLVDDSQMPINQRASTALQVLKDSGLAYTAKLKPSQLLVHPANRGGLMVNPHDVWSKGASIGEVGWDLQKVRTPVAIEIPPEGSKRKEILEANQQLAEQSNGMLAKPNGHERCCSISCSHTTAYLRCVEAGLVAVEGEKGDDMALMMREGYDRLLISWKAEEEVGSLPNLLQQALNSHLSFALVIRFVFLCALGWLCFGFFIVCSCSKRSNSIQVNIQ